MDHDYFIEQVEEDLVLLLGSNLGERFLNLADATARLTEVFGEPTQASKIYETEPWGNKDQPGFLNQALVFRSKFKPMISMEMILEIEIGLGRIREEKWGPRLIDIDIIFFGDMVYQSDLLEIPHPYMADRSFVLEPLAEIIPNFFHPLLNKKVSSLLIDLQQKNA